MNNTEQTSQLNVIRLGGVWLKFLDHAGRYAARYYMSRDLELPPNEQNPGTHLAMVRNYGTEANLLGAIERDLATFPGELRDINAAQAACGLPPFSDRDGYLDQIAMGFTMLDRHGKERREYYRRRINKLFKTLNGGGAGYSAISQSAGSRLPGESAQVRSQKSQESQEGRIGKYRSGHNRIVPAIIYANLSRFLPALFVVDFVALCYNRSTRRNISGTTASG